MELPGGAKTYVIVGVRYGGIVDYNPNNVSTFLSPLAAPSRSCGAACASSPATACASPATSHRDSHPAQDVSCRRTRVIAEVAVRVQVMVQVAADQLDHDRVVEQAARCGGRRRAEARERIERALAIFGASCHWVSQTICSIVSRRGNAP